MTRYKPFTEDDIAAVLAAVETCPDRGPVVDRAPAAGCGCGTHLCLSKTKVVGHVDCVSCKAAEMGVGVELPDENA